MTLTIKKNHINVILFKFIYLIHTYIYSAYKSRRYFVFYFRDKMTKKEQLYIIIILNNNITDAVILSLFSIEYKIRLVLLRVVTNRSAE